MLIAGIDYSSHFVDLVTISEDEGEPGWHRWPLDGQDAFDRTRAIGKELPGRSSLFWDDILAVGIEHPAGRYGVAAMTRLQGAILSQIPGRMLVYPLPPMRWRTLVGLKGYATKDDVAANVRLKLLLECEVAPVWPSDACDAYCLALATRVLLEQEAATAADIPEGGDGRQKEGTA